MTDRISIGIAGAGSVAFGTAALLAGRGHDPMLWSPSGGGAAALADGAELEASGAVEGRWPVRVAASAAELARNAVILLALPGNGHKTVMDALAPHVRDGQHIVISSHMSLGALYLGGLLADRGVRAPITNWGTTVVTGRRTAPDAVTVNTVRARIDMCTVPHTQTDAAGALCRALFGDRFVGRDGLLAISLSNLNPQNHMGIALGNITRMERGERWYQGENTTPNVGRLLEALDAERLAIAAALGLSVRTIFEHFHLSYHVPVASVAEMNRQCHVENKIGLGPASADSRYVTEDVPYGLALTAALGRLTGRPAGLHQAGIDIFSAMYGRDFIADNELLPALGLERRTLDELKTAALTGVLPVTRQVEPAS